MKNAGTLTRRGRTCAALLAASVAAASGGAQQNEEAEDSAAAGPRACLNHHMIRRTKVLDDRNIVFMTRDEAIYNNHLPQACAGLRRDSLVNYAVENRRLCGGDYFQVLWETGPGNFTPAFLCRLGSFLPISETELEDLTAMTEPQRERRLRRRSTREAVTTEQVELPPAAVEPATTVPAATESTPRE